MAIAWLPGPAGTRRRVAKPSVEEPDAAEPARPDLWGARVSNDPGLPDPVLDQGLLMAQDEGAVVMADRDVKPAFSVVTEASGRWKIELVNFQKFEEVLTRDVLNAFCCCFVHSDRLASTTTCSYASELRHGKDSIVFGRDLLTMVWFTIGTLRELAHALRALRSALKKRGLLDAGSAPWVTLRELEERWDRNKFYRDLRNGAAFHIDKKIINDGLTEMLKGSGVVPLAEGDEGEKNVSSRMSVGTLALHAGLWPSLKDLKAYGEFICTVGKDHDGVSDAIQKAFIQACEKAGIPFTAD